MKGLTFVYNVHGNLYINLTNRCPCNCTFCIRHNGDSAYGSDSLWLEREPTNEEVLAEFDKYSPDEFDEIVFCGYGEPMERAEDVVFIGKELKKRYPHKIIRLTRPKWEDSFSALLSFAQDCKKYVPQVMFTVVDVISEREIEESKEISERLGIPLRIRKYDT